MTETTNKTYNGWTNYETWAVALWIDNEEPSYRYWREQAFQCLKGVMDRGIGLTMQEQATADLAKLLKEKIEEDNPLADGPSLYSDLLNAALSEVNWHEIAAHMLSEE